MSPVFPFTDGKLFVNIERLVSNFASYSLVPTALLVEEIVNALHTGTTSSMLNNELLGLYARTGGSFQAQLNQVLLDSVSSSSLSLSCSKLLVDEGWPEQLYPSSLSILPFTVPSDSSEISCLNEYGYCISAFTLPRSFCSAIINQTFQYNVKLKLADESIQHNVHFASSLSRCDVVTAWFFPKDLYAINQIQKIVSSPYILTVVSAYLQSSWLLLKSVNLWYSLPSLKPSSESAQLFHYDQAALKWCKVFIFLSDVDPANGPHTCVLGTHKPGSKPHDLLSRGYSRISDDDILFHYSRDRVVEFCVPKGTILFGDTNAYHKGSQLRSGYRCCLELDFASNPILDIVK